ncbi:hypothetical protein H1R20_g13066, partial [Candolleomyces eurysporus]
MRKTPNGQTMTIVNRPLPSITQDENFETRLPGSLPLITPEINFKFTRESFHAQKLMPEVKVAVFQDIQCGEEDVQSSAIGSGGPALIAKPPGEPGRPNSGGFGLEQALGWPSRELKALSEWVGKQAEEKLDISQGFSGQDSDAIEDVCILAIARFPALRQYELCWPVRSILKLKLKATSEKARKSDVPTPARRLTLTRQGKGKRKGQSPEHDISDHGASREEVVPKRARLVRRNN